MFTRLTRIALFLSLIALTAAFMGCSSDSDSSSSGPDHSPYFPASYTGTYWFNVLPIWGDIAFDITSEGAISGSWVGQDENSWWWHLTIEGTVDNGRIHVTMTGGYDDIDCDITGEADGVSNDDYETFTGTWSLTECSGIGFQGTWEASRVS